MYGAVLLTALALSVQDPPPQTWSVQEVPVLQIGARENGPGLYRTVTARQAPDGALVIVQPDELLVFSPEGALRRRLGRSGDGPGEFRAIQDVRFDPEGNLLVYDVSLRRITRLSTSGRVLGTEAISRLLWPPAGEVGLHPDGSITWLKRPGSDQLRAKPSPAGVHADSVALARHLNGTTDTLAHRRDGLRYLARVGNTALDRPPPLGQRLLVAHGSGRVALGYNDEAAFDVLALSGARLASTRSPLPRRLISEEDRSYAEAHFDEEAAPAMTMQDVTSGWEAHLRQIVGNAPRPVLFPVVAHIVLDELDHLWLKRTSTNRSPWATWEVHRPEGGIAALTTLPAGIEVTEIGADYIVSRRSDEWDRDIVEVWRLQRGG